MNNGLVELLIYLLIGGLIIYVVFWILGMVEIDPRLRQVLVLVLSIIVIVWLILTFIPRFMP